MSHCKIKCWTTEIKLCNYDISASNYPVFEDIETKSKNKTLFLSLNVHPNTSRHTSKVSQLLLDNNCDCIPIKTLGTFSSLSQPKYLNIAFHLTVQNGETFSFVDIHENYRLYPGQCDNSTNENNPIFIPPENTIGMPINVTMSSVVDYGNKNVCWTIIMTPTNDYCYNKLDNIISIKGNCGSLFNDCQYRGIYGNEICAPSSVLILQNGNHLGELINLERFSEFSLHLSVNSANGNSTEEHYNGYELCRRINSKCQTNFIEPIKWGVLNYSDAFWGVITLIDGKFNIGPTLEQIDRAVGSAEKKAKECARIKFQIINNEGIVKDFSYPNITFHNNANNCISTSKTIDFYFKHPQ